MATPEDNVDKGLFEAGSSCGSAGAARTVGASLRCGDTGRAGWKKRPGRLGEVGNFTLTGSLPITPSSGGKHRFYETMPRIAAMLG